MNKKIARLLIVAFTICMLFVLPGASWADVAQEDNTMPVSDTYASIVQTEVEQASVPQVNTTQASNLQVDATQPNTSQVDAGGFSGSSGYSSSGGSSSSSSGGGYSGGGSSSSSGGGIYFFGGSGGDGGGTDGSTGLIIILLVVIVLMIVAAVKSKKDADGSAGGKGGQVQIQDTFDESKVRPILQLIEKDQTFDADDISEDISNWYVQMQNAWTAGDFSPMRPYFSDALYAQFERQLKAIKDAGQTNHTENIAVLGVNIQGWYEQDGQDFLVARVQTRINDYYTDDKTGEVVRGSKTVEKFMTYRYILSRTGVVSRVKASEANGAGGRNSGSSCEASASANGARGASSNGADANSAETPKPTSTNGAHGVSSAESSNSAEPAKTASTPEHTTINCPNCGAVVDVNKSAKCPYCDSIINANTHGWVITSIQGLEQRNGS